MIKKDTSTCLAYPLRKSFPWDEESESLNQGDVLLIFESLNSFADHLPENELLKMNDARSTYKGGTKEQRQKEGFFAQGTVYNKTV